MGKKGKSFVGVKTTKNIVNNVFKYSAKLRTFNKNKMDHPFFEKNDSLANPTHLAEKRKKGSRHKQITLSINHRERMASFFSRSAIAAQGVYFFAIENYFAVNVGELSTSALD